jgi:hypothetical protein|tara:strand:- start:3472 stop:4125 length:654 start_codon:yes stop_codon:yes gene_type:complete
MAKQNRTTLKGYFETGDIPTGGNYADLIDSPLILDTENTGSINILGSITASGDITAVTTGSFERVETTNISASGLLHVNEIQGIAIINHDNNAFGNLDFTSAGTLRLRSTNSTSYGLRFFGGSQNSAAPFIDTDSHTTFLLKVNGTERIAIDSLGISLLGNVTASGNISASGNLSAFGSSSLVGLPTTEPLVSGGLWLSGSGGGSASGSKYLMVFTG